MAADIVDAVSEEAECIVGNETNVTPPILGGGTARITRSNSATPGYAVQIQTCAGKPLKSQRIH